MASVTIPPWLNIDPIEPARLRLAANARRAQQAAAEQANQLAWERMQMAREEHAATLGSQERLAQQRMQLLREAQAANLAARGERSAQFDRQLRLRESEAEREAAAAAQQMEGMRGYQKDIDSGLSPAQAMARNATKMFASQPQRIGPSLRAVTPPEAPQPGWTPSGQEYMIDAKGQVRFPPGAMNQERVARSLLDERGQPTGMQYVPGAHGATKILTGDQLKPSDRIRILTTRLGVVMNDLIGARKADKPALQAKRDQILKQLEEMEQPRKVAGKLDEAEIAPGEEGSETALEDLLPPTGDEEEVDAGDEEE